MERHRATGTLCSDDKSGGYALVRLRMRPAIRPPGCDAAQRSVRLPGGWRQAPGLSLRSPPERAVPCSMRGSVPARRECNNGQTGRGVRGGEGMGGAGADVRGRAREGRASGGARPATLRQQAAAGPNLRRSGGRGAAAKLGGGGRSSSAALWSVSSLSG